VGSRVLLFGALLQVSTGSSVPYFVFYLIGASAWRFFDGAAYWATRSIELNRRVLRRVYIPRLIVMVAALAPTVTEYLIYGVITVIVLGYYVLTTGQLYLHFSPEMAFAPLGILLCGLMAISIGFWTAPYAAQARDVRFTLRYVLGFWLYLTPVIYPLSSVPRSYRTIAEYNPMTAPIQLVKLGVLGNTELPVGSILATVVFLCVVGFGGFVFFSRAESLALDSL
jgi:lipopolysaccharide transport system permease protein